MKRILVVDDEELMRYSLTAAFRNDETEVLAIADGRTALQVLSMARFDLCLLDVNLPDMSGLAIMRHIRSVSPATRIIIMTGSEVSDAMLRSIRESAHGLVAKPFELNEFKSFVRRILLQDAPSGTNAGGRFESASCVKWLADDFRKSERRPMFCRINGVAVDPKDDGFETPLTAEVLDISDAGMCIVTDCDLEPGNVLRFSDSPIRSSGVVKWSMHTGMGKSCRAGIQFLSREVTA